jgi:hypothetical protein
MNGRPSEGRPFAMRRRRLRLLRVRLVAELATRVDDAPSTVVADGDASVPPLLAD